MLSLLVSLLLSTPSAQAQGQTFDTKLHTYDGMHSVDGKVFYTYRKTETLKDGELQLVSPDLRVLEPITFPVSYTSGLAGATAGKDRWHFWIYNGKRAFILQTDTDGKETGRAERELVSVYQNNGQLFDNGRDGLTVLTPMKLAKKGVRVEGLGEGLASDWTLDFFPEKGALKLRTWAASQDRVVFLLEGKKKAFELIAVSHDGQELYRVPFSYGDSLFKPSRMSVAEDGTVAIISEAGSVPFADRGQSYTLWAAIHDPDGKRLGFHDAAWDAEIVESLQAGRPGLPSAELRELHVRDLVPHGDGFQLIGETVLFSAAGAPPATVAADPVSGLSLASGQAGRFRAVDVVLADLGRDGTFGQVRALGVPTKTTTTIADLGLTHVQHMASTGAKWGRLSWQFRQGDRDIVLNEHFNQFSIDAVGPDGLDYFARMYLDQQPQPGRGNGSEETSREYSHPTAANYTFTPLRHLNHLQVLPSDEPGTVVLARLAPDSGNTFGKTVSFEKLTLKPTYDGTSLGGVPDQARLLDYGTAGSFVLYPTESNVPGTAPHAFVRVDEPGEPLIVDMEAKLGSAPLRFGGGWLFQDGAADGLLFRVVHADGRVTFRSVPRGDLRMSQAGIGVLRSGESGNNKNPGTYDVQLLDPALGDRGQFTGVGAHNGALRASLVGTTDAQIAVYERANRSFVKGVGLPSKERFLKQEKEYRNDTLGLYDLQGTRTATVDLWHDTGFCNPTWYGDGMVTGVWNEAALNRENQGIYEQKGLCAFPETGAIVRLKWYDVALHMGAVPDTFRGFDVLHAEAVGNELVLVVKAAGGHGLVHVDRTTGKVVGKGLYLPGSGSERFVGVLGEGQARRLVLVDRLGGVPVLVRAPLSGTAFEVHAARLTAEGEVVDHPEIVDAWKARRTALVTPGQDPERVESVELGVQQDLVVVDGAEVVISRHTASDRRMTWARHRL